MRLPIVLLSLLSVMALASCKKEAVSTSDEAPEPAEPPAPSEPAVAEAPSAPSASVVKLLSPGAEPRRELRSNIKPGVRQKLKITVDNEIGALVTLLNMKQAPRSVTFELVVQRQEDVPAEAGAFAFTIEEISVGHPEDLRAATREARESAAASMVGMDGSYLIDSYGSVRSVEMAIPSGSSLELWGMAADLNWALRQLGVPLPRQATGTGARWTAAHAVEQDGVDASEVSTLEITKLGKQLVTIKKDVQQSAGPQTFRNPGSTVDAELTEFNGEGMGEITWDLTRPLPQSAKMTATYTKHMTYPFQGKRVEATMATRRTLSVAR